MTPDDFEHLLDTCGSAPERWPSGARESAERLLGRSKAARRALQAQREVDGWLAANGASAGFPDFAVRATARRQLASMTPVVRALRTGALASATAAAALLAVGLGTATGLAHGRGEDPGQTLTAALSWPGEAPDAV